MYKRRKFSPSERDFILKRANGCCEYCLTRYDFTPETFQIEHIEPLALGGTNELSNLAFSCGGCNNRKGQKTMAFDTQNAYLVPLFNPRMDIWSNHFQWAKNFTIIEGITNTGRATVDLLELNRTGIVNLRNVLVMIGEHPPKS